MNYKNLMMTIKISLIVILPITLTSWGTFGHEHINRATVLSLPQPMLGFFYNHIDFVTQESTVPDLRKFILKNDAEFHRHFIDLENFGSIDSLPATLAEAKEKYDSDFLNHNGILPWYIEEVMKDLTKAFKEKDKTKILYLAADLGHYMGDAHVPLHTSVNYDGQLTDQKGIHALWESQLPEAKAKNYNYTINAPAYIEDIHSATFNIIKHTHSLVNTVLLADKETKAEIKNNVYEKDSDGNMLRNKYHNPVYSPEFLEIFNNKLNGMIQKQLSSSIQNTANFWFTAWVNAGKPDLSNLDDSALTKSNKKMMNKELAEYKKGKLMFIKSVKEF